MQSDDRLESRENLRARLDAMGEPLVRAKFIAGDFQNNKYRIAEEWLAEKDEAARAQKERAERETDRKIARRSNCNAFWLGISGNLIALGALIVAIIALNK